MKQWFEATKPLDNKIKGVVSFSKQAVLNGPGFLMGKYYHEQ